MTATIHDARITSRPISELRANPRNARTHSKRQIKLIAESIRAFGFLNPILLDDADTVLAGHGRLAGARMVGLDSVPTLRLSGLSEAERRAYVLADNKIAEEAGWDREMLALELGELAVLLPSEALDLSLTGFALGEVDIIIGDHQEVRHEPEDEVGSPPDAPVSRPGDLWAIGPHRVLCGDARDGEALDRLLAGAVPRMVFTDPPYNVPVVGHVTRGPRHGEFAMASGEMSETEFGEFLADSLGQAIRVSTPGSVHQICIDWRGFALLHRAVGSLYDALLNVCVWNKGTAGQGSFYRSQHEFVAVFRVKGAGHQNNVELGRHGRNRSNLWSYPGVSGFGAERAAALAMHPTVKPVALVADAIRDCTSKGDLVLDPFLGSGTTLVAAAKVGRRGYGLEYEPRFVDVIVRRLEAYTGLDAVLEEDGRGFAEIEAARGGLTRPEPARAGARARGGNGARVTAIPAGGATPDGTVPAEATLGANGTL